jgi:2-oxoglutarate ferredoxin oxidoreductase subunit alpha
MTPVILLSDGYIANSSEPWKIRKADELPEINVKFRTDPEGFLPFNRDPETLARDWVRPGTPGLEHRIGGLEHTNDTGNISYDPLNHELMTRIRAEKIQGIAKDIPLAVTDAGDSGDLLLIGWGGTYGSLHSAAGAARAKGIDVSHLHLRYIHPFPANLGDLMGRFKRVLVAELNRGQLAFLLRATYLFEPAQYNKVQGQPFQVSELVAAIEKAQR